MKKVFYIIILLILTEVIFASEDIYLNIDMPKKIKVGNNFTIEVYVNLSKNISGFECSIDIPIYGTEYIQFINVTGNEEIKEKADEFYKINLRNSSIFISFVLFDKPLNSDFHLLTVKGKALKEGNVTIRFTAIASDEEGRAITLSPIVYNLEIVGNNQDNYKKTDETIFSWIIKIISNFLKIIFGG